MLCCYIESASDVFDRVSIFLDSLWRSFEMNRSRNYVLVTHGIAIRVFLARYFRYTIDQFNILSNPRNCEMVVLGHNGDGRLELDGRAELIWEEDAEGKVKMKGYSVNKRLRILPQAAIRRVAIRISPDDFVDNPEAVIEILLKHKQLLQRPVVVKGKKAIIGRPKERIAEFLR